MACNKGTYGSATSPVIAGDRLIYICDVGSIRYLLALNKKDGSKVWKTSLPNPSVQSNTGGHSAPCIFNDKIYVHHLGSVSCFSIKNGSLLSRFQINTEGVSSPIIVGDKVVTACWFNFSEADQRSNLPSYDELVKNWDKDQNGKISKAEFPDDMILCQRPEIKESEGGAPTKVKLLWGRYFDQNKDGEIVREIAFTCFLLYWLYKGGYMFYNILPESFLLLWIMIILGIIRSFVKIWIILKNQAVLFNK